MALVINSSSFSYSLTFLSRALSFFFSSTLPAFHSRSRRTRVAAGRHFRFFSSPLAPRPSPLDPSHVLPPARSLHGLPARHRPARRTRNQASRQPPPLPLPLAQKSSPDPRLDPTRCRRSCFCSLLPSPRPPTASPAVAPTAVPALKLDARQFDPTVSAPAALVAAPKGVATTAAALQIGDSPFLGNDDVFSIQRLFRAHCRRVDFISRILLFEAAFSNSGPDCH